MEVRSATAAELPAVMTVLDSGSLETSAATVESAIDAGRVLVAADGGPVLGALVLEPTDATDVTRISAIAVRPGRRGQGIGTALVQAATDRYGRLVAEFGAGVRPFWDAQGFDVKPAGTAGRFEGAFGPGAERDEG